MSEIDRLRAALRWYATEAKAMKQHAASGTGFNALMSTMQRLADDGGRRAEDALAERASDQPKAKA